MASISLCIPIFRSAAFLPELLERLHALDPKPAEIIFLDDASPDESADLLRRLTKNVTPGLSFHLISNATNTGIAAAYNRLVREAHSEWIQILDADDYPVEADFYARVADELFPRRDILVTAIDSSSRLLRAGAAAFVWLVPNSPPQWLPMLGSFATRAGVIYRRDLLLATPFPDPAYSGSDVLHLLALRRNNNCGFTRKAHVYYRVHASATSSNRRTYRQYRLELSRLGWATRLAHMLDLGIRIAGQRISRPRS